MRLLLVEDEPEIQSFLKQPLADAGYEVDAATDGRTAVQFASEKKYDVLIVDLGLPDQDGIDLILQLRRSGMSSPVLILSARRSVDDRVKGLEQGGDDYLTKPFALAELLARLRNLLRRNLATSEEATRLRVLDLELDFITRRASRGEEVLNLSPQEFVLLTYLCRHAGRVVTRSMLLSEVWGMRIQPNTNVVDVHIYRLRVLDLELDFISRRASRGEEVLNLSPQEFVLLTYLCRHAGRVVTRSMLLSEVWGMRFQPNTNVVDVHIYRLRGKVDTEGREPLIRTLRGIGYVLKDR